MQKMIDALHAAQRDDPKSIAISLRMYVGMELYKEFLSFERREQAIKNSPHTLITPPSEEELAKELAKVRGERELLCRFIGVSED